MKKGYLKAKLGGIPNDWKEKLMPEVSWFQEGPGLRKWQFKDEGIKVINITNMVNGILDLSRTTRHISIQEFNKTYKHFECDEDDIVIASSGNSYCKHAIVRKQDLPLVMNTSVIRFKPLSDIIYDYLNQFLKSSLFKEQIDFMITGGAQPNFGPIHLNKVVLALPPLLEQQKIAEILSTVDAKIEIIDQQISETSELKKGLMQRLLTKGIGHTKFKDSVLGEIPESWEVVKVEELFNFISTKSLSRAKLTYEEGELFYIHYGDIHSTFKFQVVDVNNENLPKVKSNITIPGTIELLKDGDLILADASEDMEGVGKCIELLNTRARKIIGGLHTIVLRDKLGITTNGYKTYLFRSPLTLPLIKRIATGASVLGVSKGNLKDIDLAVPPLVEQKQISQILSSVDDKLQVLSEKKVTYQELKQGLMQQLLTGKVRVKV